MVNLMAATFSCPECGSTGGFEELARIVEASAVEFELVDGQLKSRLSGDSAEIISGEVLGYRCTSCRAEFAQPKVSF